MSIVVNVFAFLLGTLGCLFIVGYQGQTGRLLIGLILIGAGAVLFVTLHLRPKQTTFVQKIDLTGDLSAQELKCKNCGSTLTNKSVAVRSGAIFISCEFCGTQYQLEDVWWRLPIEREARDGVAVHHEGGCQSEAPPRPSFIPVEQSQHIGKRAAGRGAGVR